MTVQELRSRKRELGYTNEMIANMSGVPLGTVNKIFAGVTASPRYETMKALERILGQPLQTSPYPAEAVYNNSLIVEPAVSYGERAVQTWPYGERIEPVSPEGYAKDCGAKELPGLVRESSPRYAQKKQGEFTWEDYENLPDNFRAELIDGVFFEMCTPSVMHQLIVSQIWNGINTYIQTKKGTCIPLMSPLAVRLDANDKTAVEPDVLVVCDRGKIKKRWIWGAPDLVVEILSPSTKKKDMTLKLYKYEKAGVKEYWIVDPVKKKVLVYDFALDFDVRMYGFADRVPVGIFEGECEIDFRAIEDYCSFLETEDT